jgi:hypothetical protein
MFHHKALSTAAVIAFSAISANAATVAIDGTKAGGAFTIEGGGTAVEVSDPNNAWILSDTDPDSEWIWDEALVNSIDGDTFGGPVTFLYKFTLAGFNAATAKLKGVLAFDDNIIVKLNGNVIFSDQDGGGSNWGSFRDYSSTSFFVDGDNVLSYFVTNDGRYPAGLRATVEVEASPIPVPAALPLLAAALGAFGLVGMRRKRANAA